MINTPYDDVFRTLLNDCKQLIFPVLNEIFGENYSGNEDIKFSQNEIYLTQQDGEQEKRITDSCFIIRDDKKVMRYHLECESNPDRSIIVRIFEYDTQIALNDREQEGYRLKVNFPHTAVIALRASGKMPESMSVEINTPGGSVEYDVPVLKTQVYSLDEIFDKNLLFLLPFYIFSYEKQFKKYDADESQMAEMVESLKLIVKRLGDLIQDGKLDQYTAQTLIFCFNKVAKSLAVDHANVLKGVDDVMGGKILEYEAKDILREGQEARAKATAERMYKKKMSVEEIADLVGYSVEIVKKWLGLTPAKSIKFNRSPQSCFPRSLS